MSIDSVAVTNAEIDRVLELERELQTPVARGSEQRLRELLAPDFIEIGASGRCWDLASTLDQLALESGDPGRPEIGVRGMRARVLCDDIVQVFWDSDQDGRLARRTSLWQRSGDRWQQIYHQGSLLS